MAILGPVLGAFGSTKIKQRNYSDAVQDALTGAAKATAQDRAANAADLAAYTDALRRASSRVEALNPEDTATLGRMIGETASADPMSVYRGIGDYQMGLFDRFSRGLAEQGRRGQNLQFARMGYGGRGGSTYTQNALLDRISQNLAPVFAQVSGNLGRDTQILGNQRLAQGGQVASLIGARRGLQTQGADLLLNPALARSDLASAEANRIGALGSAARTNTAGFEQQKNTLARFAEGLSEAEDTILDTAMGVLSMYSGGGLGGIMGGGGGGGGGRGDQTPGRRNTGPMASGYQFQPAFAPQVPTGAAPAGAGFYSPQVQDILYGYRPGL